MKCPHVSSGIFEINYKSLPRLILISPNKLLKKTCHTTKTEYLPYFVVKLKIKCLPVLWLSIAYTDTVLMLQFCLPYVHVHLGFEWYCRVEV